MKRQRNVNDKADTEQPPDIRFPPILQRIRDHHVHPRTLDQADQLCATLDVAARPDERVDWE